MANTALRDAPTKETVARLRYLRTSPTKIRPVLKLITGSDISSARDTLYLCPRGVSHELQKLLNSAVANAENNDNIPEDELFVVRAFADEGTIQKRWRPRARGRASRINKRTSHITIAVSRFSEEEISRRSEAGVGTTARRRTNRRPAPEAIETEEVTEAEKSAPAATKKATKKATKSTKKAATKSTKKAATKTATTKKAATKTATTKKAATKSTKKTAKKPASEKG
ncbi:MAG: 50S ribosomal protein L22 [Acidimicrobiia bacterium]|nr:50S ribosomal protein L22 [Acidimicrobiia bacterium]